MLGKATVEGVARHRENNGRKIYYIFLLCVPGDFVLVLSVSLIDFHFKIK